MIPGGGSSLGYWCHRFWPSKNGGVNLCTLRRDHGGDYCIDTFNNVSRPTSSTEPSAWERAMARRVQES